MRSVYFQDTDAVSHDVTLAGAAGGAWAFVDESTAYSPAANFTLASDTWTLAPFAVGVLRLAA